MLPETNPALICRHSIVKQAHQLRKVVTCDQTLFGNILHMYLVVFLIKIFNYLSLALLHKRNPSLIVGKQLLLFNGILRMFLRCRTIKGLIFILRF